MHDFRQTPDEKGKKWVYAVMVLMETGSWLYASGSFQVTSEPTEADWKPTLQEAEDYAEIRRRSAKSTLIVRREADSEETPQCR